MEPRTYRIHYYSSDDCPCTFDYKSAHRKGSKANLQDLKNQHYAKNFKSIYRHLCWVLENDSYDIELVPEDHDRILYIAPPTYKMPTRADVGFTDEETATIEAFIVKNRLISSLTNMTELKPIKLAHNLSWNDFRHILEYWNA